MQLFLMRHGEVEPANSLRYPTGDRPLSARGREILEKIGAALKHRGIKPGIILHSPAARTTETATIIGAALGVKISPLNLLAEDMRPQDWQAELANRFVTHQSLMLVGHEPGLVGFVEAVCGISSPRIEVSRGTFIELRLASLIPNLSGQMITLLKPENN